MNASIANDARALHRLVNVATDPQDGNFGSTSGSSRRSNSRLVSQPTNVPSAAARIRDAIAERFDVRYANALEKIGDERAKAAWRHERSVDARECSDDRSGFLRSRRERHVHRGDSLMSLIITGLNHRNGADRDSREARIRRFRTGTAARRAEITARR